MPTCPSCGDEFDTRRGLGVHHSSAHDERLPNRECAHCESEFYCEYERKYCSDDCRDRAVSFEGENNPNYRGGKETRRVRSAASRSNTGRRKSQGNTVPVVSRAKTGVTRET